MDAKMISELKRGDRVCLEDDEMATITKIERCHIVDAIGGAYEVKYRGDDGEDGQAILAGSRYVVIKPT